MKGLSYSLQMKKIWFLLREVHNYFPFRSICSIQSHGEWTMDVIDISGHSGNSSRTCGMFHAFSGCIVLSSYLKHRTIPTSQSENLTWWNFQSTSRLWISISPSKHDSYSFQDMYNLFRNLSIFWSSFPPHIRTIIFLLTNEESVTNSWRVDNHYRSVGCFTCDIGVSNT